jgi:hypothetical protein
MKWLRFPLECPSGRDKCLECEVFEPCVEYFILVRDDEDEHAVFRGNRLYDFE